MQSALCYQHAEGMQTTRVLNFTAVFPVLLEISTISCHESGVSYWTYFLWGLNVTSCLFVYNNILERSAPKPLMSRATPRFSDAVLTKIFNQLCQATSEDTLLPSIFQFHQLRFDFLSKVRLTARPNEGLSILQRQRRQDCHDSINEDVIYFSK